MDHCVISVLSWRPWWVKELLIFSIEIFISFFSIADTSRWNTCSFNNPFKFYLYKNPQIPQVVFLYKAVISSSAAKSGSQNKNRTFSITKSYKSSSLFVQPLHSYRNVRLCGCLIFCLLLSRCLYWWSDLGNGSPLWNQSLVLNVVCPWSFCEPCWLSLRQTPMQIQVFI